MNMFWTVNTAFEGRPGPVHIHVPENLAERGVTVRNYHDLRLDVAPVRPDPGQVEVIAGALADAIRDGRRIVLLAGFGAIRAHAEPAVLRFVERFQVPLITTLDGKGIVAETHDVEHDEQALAAGHLVPFADAEYMTVNSPIEIGGQVKVPPRHAPKVGEHSDQVLRDAGYGDAEIAALREANVIG